MMKLLATVAVATLALASPVVAQNSTQMVSGPGVTCAPSTASTSTDTTASTSAATTSTMALGADNQVNAQTARTSLSNSQTNVDKLSTLGAATTVVCVVDLDTLAESDATLKEDISKYQSNNAQIKSALEGNAQILGVIKAQHPTFDINHVVGTDIGPSGELVLYVSRS
jgi:hypothetical protein